MDLALLIAVTSLIAILLILILLLKPKASPPAKPNNVEQEQPRRQAVEVDREARPTRVRRNRLRPTPASRVDDDDDEEEEDPLAEQIALPEGKIGTKKRRKLEMKAERRAQREMEEQEREERQQRQAQLEEQRQKQEQLEREQEAKLEEEERLRKEEIARQEHEEYLKLKEAFTVEEEGCDEKDDSESQEMLKEFVEYIKNTKVVLLDDLAAHFKLKTQDAINRLQTLQTSGQISGVIDDRGKFIYISKEELEAVAKFIHQRGRVSIAELVESSNTIINLTSHVL